LFSLDIFRAVSLYADLSQYSEPELQRWLHLRAIEWCAWPVFLSQPVLPLLIIIFPPVAVLVSIVAAEVLWRFVRYSYVSPRLASAGATFVIFLKWPCAIGAAIYLLVQHRYPVAAFAILWPLIASIASLPATFVAALFRRHTQVGVVELELAKRIGYVSQDAVI
jgi:hypothetical protein